MLFDRGLFDRGLLTPGAFDWGLLTEEHIPGGLFRGAIVVEPYWIIPSILKRHRLSNTSFFV
jgi:hypothetical protein